MKKEIKWYKTVYTEKQNIKLRRISYPGLVESFCIAFTFEEKRFPAMDGYYYNTELKLI